MDDNCLSSQKIIATSYFHFICYNNYVHIIIMGNDFVVIIQFIKTREHFNIIINIIIIIKVIVIIIMLILMKYQQIKIINQLIVLINFSKSF